MNQSDDAGRLADNWYFWSATSGLTSIDAWVQADGELRFLSDEYSVHLRHTEDWWVIDTVDDRGQLRENVAKFSSLELAEKFLIWQWSFAARNVLRLTPLGPDFYARGIDSAVEAVAIDAGTYEVRLGTEHAVLMEPSATIFSHLMSKSVGEIDAIVKVGITEPRPNSNQ
ncbi:hypothetical protein [Mycolicibacterium diernhoferi]|uniref:Uncharacterized protein n=1 Tax=Mycolicibacterium diernhoferi TaxID=1801 RepID=A0A2A7NYY8_9MYCO|nr:hypothetical protein [Mycolicibacterium diernhoferi]PEG55493.1 hypothetical protein CRI78_06170 [Mycolicibacterium diernhoferi]QYL24411.1 hypothetical protein K0O62_09215 [Mycolicibacterium diernhoferi]